MRMQFFAVRCSVGLTLDALSSREAFNTGANHDATSPVPAIWKNWRREKPAPKSGKEPPRSQSQRSGFDMVSSFFVDR